MYSRLIADHIHTLWSKANIGSFDPFAQAVMTKLPSYDEVVSEAPAATRPAPASRPAD